MKKAPFIGSGVAIITPFNPDGSINFDKLGELIEFQIENKTDSIIICGTTGESATMPDAEHLSAIDYTVKKVAGRIPVIAGAGSNDTKHGVELATKAEKLGIDALLLVTPYYNKATQKGLIRHFTAYAEAVSCPIILYNVPGRTGVNIKPETALALSKIDNIVGIKEASGDIAQVAKIAQLCGPDFYIYSGNDDMIVPTMSLGGKGVISVLANVVPRDVHDMVYKFIEGDTEGALKLQLDTFELTEALFIEVNPIPVKTAMNLMGYEVGDLRMPLCEMDDKNLEILRKALVNYGVSVVK